MSVNSLFANTVPCVISVQTMETQVQTLRFLDLLQV